MRTELARLLEMEVAERLQLIEDLWESITPEDVELCVTDEKRQELLRRKERYTADPSSGRTWEQVQRQARKTHAPPGHLHG